MTMSVTLPEASSANGDETLWTSADPQPGPTSELPTLPSQLLAKSNHLLARMKTILSSSQTFDIPENVDTLRRNEQLL